MLRCSVFLALALFAWIASSAGAKAQGAADPGMATLRLTAALGAGAPLDGGLALARLLRARRCRRRACAGRRVEPRATDAAGCPPGDYVLHVAFGLASATRSVSLAAEPHSEQLSLAAGALRIHGTLGDAPIDPSKLALAIYVPERNNSQAKLV